MPECDECSREFDSEKGLKIHRTQVHGSNFQENCAYCSSDIEVTPSEKKQSDNHYCDRECYTKSNRGEGNPMYGRTRSEKVKQTISEKLTGKVAGENNPMYGTTRSHTEESKQKMSKSSSGEKNPMYGKNGENHPKHGISMSEGTKQLLRKINSGKNHHNWKERVTVTCVVCDGEFEVRPKDTDRRTCCSNDCQFQYLSDILSGENHYNWKGGVIEGFGPEWYQQRQKCLKRDDYSCQICGLTQDESQKQFGVGLHVHHIKPRREFGDTIPSEANHLSNLVTLCLPCHNKVEQDTIDCPQPHSRS